MSEKPFHSIAYLDGIRGVAAFLVFFHHFLLAFYTSYYTYDLAASHLHGFEIKYGKSIFSVLSNGNFCVEIFFVLSGFVLSRKYFSHNDFKVLISGFHRRFVRLYIPVAITLIIAYILMIAKLYYNQPVSHIAHSEWWFAGQWNFTEPGSKFIRALSYSALLMGDSTFDTCMWTLSLEFFGSLFVFAFWAFTHFTRFRLLMLLSVLLYFYFTGQGAYMAFVLGMSLCYTERWLKSAKRKYISLFAPLLLALGIVLGSYPTTNDRAGTLFEHLGHTLLEYTDVYHTAGAYLLVLAFVISPILQRVAGLRALVFLGYISFFLYLLHPLLMGSYSSWLFLKLFDKYGYNHSVVIVFLTTIPILFAVSWLMTKYIDRSGISLAKRFYKFVQKKPEADIAPAIVTPG